MTPRIWSCFVAASVMLSRCRRPNHDAVPPGFPFRRLFATTASASGGVLRFRRCSVVSSMDSSRRSLNLAATRAAKRAASIPLIRNHLCRKCVDSHFTGGYTTRCLRAEFCSSLLRPVVLAAIRLPYSWILSWIGRRMLDRLRATSIPELQHLRLFPKTPCDCGCA